MIRGFQWDLARQVEKLDWLLAQLPKYARWGYQELHLHLEDAVDYPSLPGVARADAYSWAEFQQLVATAGQHGIKVVPIVNLLGHTQYLIKTPEFRDLNELRAADGTALPQGQICPSDPRTLDVAARLIADVAPYCTAGKVHVGLDESFHLGKHPASHAEIKRTGLAAYFAQYVCDLYGIAHSHGLRTAIWADMLVLLPEAIAHLPQGLIAYDWYYHAFARHPRFELHNFKTYNLAPKLRAQGVEYWGCPMNGAFRHEPLPVFGERIANAQSWWARCQMTKAEGFLVTGWEPNRLALETTVLIDAAIAGLWLDSAPHDQVSLLRRGFERVYGQRHAAEHARLMLAADERAFAGYARWEINARWDTIHGRDGVSRYQADERFFSRSNSRQKLPPAFAASFQWRKYLAIRDQFVRQTHIEINRARRLLKRNRHKDFERWRTKMARTAEHFTAAQQEGRNAAAEMWNHTRESAETAPNLRQMQHDQTRLAEWKIWLTATEHSPDAVFRTSPFGGAWNFYGIVHTLRPALQQIVIQIQDSAGHWQDQHERYLIEFRTKAARPRANIRHWLSFPVDSPHSKLRLVSRGIGQLAVSDVHLSNGIEELRPKIKPARKSKRTILGVIDPIRNFFEFDRSQNQAVWTIEWVVKKTNLDVSPEKA